MRMKSKLQELQIENQERLIVAIWQFSGKFPEIRSLPYILRENVAQMGDRELEVVPAYLIRKSALISITDREKVLRRTP
jgi:hypothetical protein